MPDILSSMLNNTLFNNEKQKSLIPLQEKKTNAPDDDDIGGDGGDYSLPDDEEIANDEVDSEEGGDYSLPNDDTENDEETESEDGETENEEPNPDENTENDEETTDGEPPAEEEETPSYSLDDAPENPESGEDSTYTDSPDEGGDTGGGEPTDPVLQGKKLRLIEAMSELYNSISTVLIELNNISPNTKEERELYNAIVDTLGNTRDMIYTYILLRYPKSTYEQNLMAYYSFEASIEICKSLLGKMNEIRNPKS